LKIPKGLSFRSAGLSREESALSLLAASRFLAHKAGFRMNKEVFLRELAPRPGIPPLAAGQVLPAGAE
jgi:hypothetical protein